MKFLDEGALHIIDTPQGQQIDIDTYDSFLLPGAPGLPAKHVLIALPPQSTLISAELHTSSFIRVPGIVHVAPVSPLLPLDDGRSLAQCSPWNDYQEIYDQVYSSNEAYPQDMIQVKASGTFHCYPYLSLLVCPFQYYPDSGELYYVTDGVITITYSSPSSLPTEVMKSHQSPSFDEMSTLFINSDLFTETNPLDKPETSGLNEAFDYVIITTDALVSAVTSSEFIEWKKSVGYSVKIVTITDTDISDQPGVDLAEKIRNFLRSSYESWGIRYVLLVGDITTIPMRYCYPNPENHRFDPFDYLSGEVPTDYYYADLSLPDAESWDADGDGYYGEYKQDYPDFLAEVYVGRIPTSDSSRITYTLNKLVFVEQDTGAWKKHALHAGAFFYFANEDNTGSSAMDGAVLSYYIEQDIMQNWTVSHYSEQQGLETSQYSWPAINQNAFITDWREGAYAVVNWQGHGWTNGAARKVWTYDDGDEIPESNEIAWPYFITSASLLDDDHPSVVTAVSCYIGCPEYDSNGNLGIDLLTDPSSGAACAVVASARSPYGSEDWPVTPGGSDAIIYEFNRYMITEKEPFGDALYHGKFYANYHYGWDSYPEYLDMYTFNLFGDPSMKLQGRSDNQPPETPIVTGPSRITRGQIATYTFSASDPEDDDIYLWIDWTGDSSDEQWEGPFTSGEHVIFNHSWEKQGSYTLRVKAKDDQGAESEWSFLELTVPKFRWWTMVLQLLCKNAPPISHLK
jgi:hypothetical protein